jgi:hypothetical protein
MGDIDLDKVIQDFPEARVAHTLRVAAGQGFSTLSTPSQPRPRTRFSAYAQVAQSATLSAASAHRPLTLNLPVAPHAAPHSQQPAEHAFATMHTSAEPSRGLLSPSAAPARQWLLTLAHAPRAADRAWLLLRLGEGSLDHYLPDNTFVVTATPDAIARVLPEQQGGPRGGPVRLVAELHPAMKLAPTLSLGGGDDDDDGNAGQPGRGGASRSHLYSRLYDDDADADAHGAAPVSPARAPASLALHLQLAHPPQHDRPARRAHAMAVARELLAAVEATAVAEAAVAEAGAGPLPAGVDAREFLTLAVADREGDALSAHVHALGGDGRGALRARAWAVGKVAAELPRVHWVEPRARHRSLNKYSNTVTQAAE